MIVTHEYVKHERERAYGNTVYRCVCGWQGFGTPVTLHGMRLVGGRYVECGYHNLMPLEHYVGQDVETFHS